MAAEDHLSGQQFFHGTRADLDNETHILPPAKTGLSPNWDDMDPEEEHKVYMAHDSLSAENWANETEGDSPARVYQVDPEGDIDHRVNTTAASRARILKRVL